MPRPLTQQPAFVGKRNQPKVRPHHQPPPLVYQPAHGIHPDYDGHIEMRTVRGGDEESLPYGYTVHDEEQASYPLHTNPDTSHFGRQQYKSVNAFYKREQALQDWRQFGHEDTFLSQVYQFYTGGGLYCLIMAHLFNLLTTAFVIGFTSFLFGCIDHSKITPGNGLGDVLVEHCITHLHPILIITNLIFGALWTYEALRFLFALPSYFRMHDFYTHLLNIPDSDLQMVQWHSVVHQLVDLQNSELQDEQPKCNAHHLVNRLMRKENYLIALYNKDLLDLRIPLPRVLGSRGNMLLTQVMEWHLNFSLFDYIFDEVQQGTEMRVRPEILKVSNKEKIVQAIKKRMFWMGVVHLLLSPFILVFLLIYFFFTYGEEFHKNPHQLSARQYTRLAQWKFRSFNELSHIFQQRLNRSHSKATAFLNQFPQLKVAILAKFVSFVAGSLALALGLLSFFDEDILLTFQITHGRTVIWYMGVFGAIWTVTRALVPEPHTVYDPENLMMEVVDDTYYLPSTWRKEGLHSTLVRREFAALFEYRVVIFMRELLSVMVAPLILWISLPRCVDEIVDFFRIFTMHVDGTGWVCSFSVFDFQHFDHERGLNVPLPPSTLMANPSMDQRLPENEAMKLESSIMEFKKNYPEWEPESMENSLFVQQLMEKDAQQEPSRWQRKLRLAGYTGSELSASLMASAMLRPTLMGESSLDQSRLQTSKQDKGKEPSSPIEPMDSEDDQRSTSTKNMD